MSSGLFGVELRSEIVVLGGEQPGLRVEAVVAWELSAHFIQVSG